MLQSSIHRRHEARYLGLARWVARSGTCGRRQRRGDEDAHIAEALEQLRLCLGEHITCGAEDLEARVSRMWRCLVQSEVERMDVAVAGQCEGRVALALRHGSFDCERRAGTRVDESGAAQRGAGVRLPLRHQVSRATTAHDLRLRL